MAVCLKAVLVIGILLMLFSAVHNARMFRIRAEMWHAGKRPCALPPDTTWLLFLSLFWSPGYWKRWRAHAVIIALTKADAE